MTKEELLEKLTGEKSPNYVTVREDTLINNCLLIINDIETQLIASRDSRILSAVPSELEQELTLDGRRVIIRTPIIVNKCSTICFETEELAKKYIEKRNEIKRGIVG